MIQFGTIPTRRHGLSAAGYMSLPWLIAYRFLSRFFDRSCNFRKYSVQIREGRELSIAHLSNFLGYRMAVKKGNHLGAMARIMLAHL